MRLPQPLRLATACTAVLFTASACSDGKNPTMPPESSKLLAPVAQTFVEAAELGSLQSFGWSVKSPGVTAALGPSLTAYTDRAALEATCGELRLEDFEEMPPVLFISVPVPLDETSNNGAFAPGDIEPGIRITTSDPASTPENDLVTVPAGEFGVSSDALVVNTFSESWVMEFPDGDVSAVGGEMITLLGSGSVDITINGADGVLGTVNVPASPAGSFWGVTADQPIASVVVRDPCSGEGCGAEGVDQISFGECSLAREVEVDVAPGEDHVRLDEERLRVAVLTAGGFNAADVNPAGLTLGDGEGGDVSLAVVVGKGGNARFEDVDDDRDLDLVIDVDQRALEDAGELHAATTELIVRGETYEGDPIMGMDEVTVLEQDEEADDEEKRKPRPRCFLWFCR